MFEISIKDIIDIFLVALMLFYIYRLMKESRSLNVFIGIIVFVVIWLFVSQVLEMRLLGAIMDKLVSVGVLALIVLFQEDIRRFLYSLGAHQRFQTIMRFFFSNRDKDKNIDKETIMPIVMACMGWIGTIALASHQVMTTISQFTFMVYYGLGAAVAVRVSYFHGQSDHQGTRQTVIAGLHLMVALELLLGGIIFLLRYDIGSWFTDSAAVTSGVVSLMLPFFIYQFGDGLQITYANALRGIADVKPLVVIAFIAFFVISLPLSYVFAFPLGYGLVGVWMAFPFGLTTAGVMMWWRFRRQMKALDKSPKA